MSIKDKNPSFLLKILCVLAVYYFFRLYMFFMTSLKTDDSWLTIGGLFIGILFGFKLAFIISTWENIPKWMVEK